MSRFHFLAGAGARSRDRCFVLAVVILLSTAATVCGAEWSQIDSGLRFGQAGG